MTAGDPRPSAAERPLLHSALPSGRRPGTPKGATAHTPFNSRDQSMVIGELLSSFPGIGSFRRWGCPMAVALAILAVLPMLTYGAGDLPIKHPGTIRHVSLYSGKVEHKSIEGMPERHVFVFQERPRGP